MNLIRAINAPSTGFDLGNVALLLRLGLGSVFIIGGLAKLSRLLHPERSDGIVTQYMGSLGYINQTFQELLFTGVPGAILSPWLFLTTLSAFEFVAGIMLVVGVLVRALALVWTLLLWSFVFSLPVVTTPGVAAEATYASPALLVQVRDVTLSGLFAALYLIGAGNRSVDGAVGLTRTTTVSWNTVGTLIRLSLGLAFIVGGVFHGFHKIPTFGTPAIILVVVGVGLLFGVAARAMALAAAAVLVVFMASKIGDATGLLGWLNAVKREFALLAAAVVVALAGGGHSFTANALLTAIAEGWARYLNRPRPDTTPAAT